MTQDAPTPRRQRTIVDLAQTEVSEVVERQYASGVITPRKRRMIEAYVREGTYAAAARASGYTNETCKKYLDSDPAVRKAVGQLVDQAAAVTGVTLERVLQEYSRLAFSDIGELMEVLKLADVDSEAGLDALAELPAEITAAISEISMSRKNGEKGDDNSFKVKFYSKTAALSDLGRVLSMFHDKIEITDTSGFGDRLKRAVEKIERLDEKGSDQ